MDLMFEFLDQLEMIVRIEIGTPDMKISYK